MHHFDFTPMIGSHSTSMNNRRPTAAMIVSAWKKAGRPDVFSVAYGETFAEFQRYRTIGLAPRWDDSGNGCRGVDRAAVVKLLERVQA